METVKADAYKRVRIPVAFPRQVFDYAVNDDGSVLLTPIKKSQAPPVKSWLKKKGRFTVLVTDAVVSREELQKALDELP